MQQMLVLDIGQISLIETKLNHDVLNKWVGRTGFCMLDILVKRSFNTVV